MRGSSSLTASRTRTARARPCPRSACAVASSAANASWRNSSSQDTRSAGCARGRRALHAAMPRAGQVRILLLHGRRRCCRAAQVRQGKAYGMLCGACVKGAGEATATRRRKARGFCDLPPWEELKNELQTFPPCLVHVTMIPASDA
jgi:hypothetical protein